MSSSKADNGKRDQSPKRQIPTEVPLALPAFELWMEQEDGLFYSTFGRIRDGNQIIDNGDLPADLPEVFETHPNFPNLQVSTLGRVKRDRIDIKSTGHNCRIFESDGTVKLKGRAMLVAETFLGLPDPAYCLRNSASPKDFKLSDIFWEVNGQSLLESQLFRNAAEVWTSMAYPYSLYKVSSAGRMAFQGRILSNKIGITGYPMVTITDDDGHTARKPIHVYVAYNKYGYFCPSGWNVAHLDDNKLNNFPDNLEYQTRSQNMSQANQKRQQPVLANCANSGQVLRFKSLKETAHHFNVHIPTITRKCKNKTSIALDNSQWYLSFLGEPQVKMQERKFFSKYKSLNWIKGTSKLTLGYEFTSTGLVHKLGSKYLSNISTMSGYSVTTVNGGIGKIHLLILDVFHCSKPGINYAGDHIDENKLHNCASNLQWTTRNTERSCGIACERQNKDDSWQRFNSVLSAAREIIFENNEIFQNDRDKRKQEIRVSSAIREAVKRGGNQTSYGFKWRKLTRSADSNYTCPDCNKVYMKRGDWIIN